MTATERAGIRADVSHSLRELAAAFGVSHETVRKIRNGTDTAS